MINPIKEAPTNVLCDAARTLQEAHDLVEENEFNINVHGARLGSPSCCFIGSVHRVAGEHDVNEECVTSLSSKLALQALDMATIRSGFPDFDYFGRQFGESTRNGGIAEAQFKRLHQELPRSEQKEKALPFYRQAIREVQAELMTRKDVPVPA